MIYIKWIWTSIGENKNTENSICKLADKKNGYLKERTWLQQTYTTSKPYIKLIEDSINKCLLSAKIDIWEIDGIFTSHSLIHQDKIVSLSATIATLYWINQDKNIICKDINAACSWFWDATSTVYNQIIVDWLNNKGNKNYLVVVGDLLGSNHRDLTDIRTWMFSDWVWSAILSSTNTHNNLQIIKAESWLSLQTTSENLKSIYQLEWEKMKMPNPRALKEMLWGTADQIFNILNVKELIDGTLIIPHQPNATMIKERWESSTIIQNAIQKWYNIQIHDQTYKTLWNLSWASTIFALEKELQLENRYKDIILMMFGAWWHISGIQIKKQ